MSKRLTDWRLTLSFTVLFQFAAVGAGCINANLAENGGFHKQIAVFFVDFISEFI